MKQVLFLLAFAMITMHGFGQYNEAYISRSLENKEYATIIPFEWINGKIIVPVQIGPDTLRFLFDTGSLTLIKRSVAEKYGFPDLSTANMIDAHNQTSEAKVSLIDSLRVGELVLTKIPSFVLEEEHEALTCLAIDGFLGSNVWIGSEISIDYLAQKIAIQNSRGRTHPHIMAVNSQNMPLVEVNWHGKKISFLFDSGDNSLGSINNQAKRKIKRFISCTYRRRGIASMAVSGFSKPEEMELLRVKNGDLLHGNLSVAKSNTLGAEILKRGVMTMDFQTGSWRFQPYERTERPLPKQLNMTPLSVNGRLIVGQIDRQIKDISVGDEILEIEAINLEEITLCALIRGEIIDRLEGKTCKVKTSNGVKEITLQNQAERPDCQ